MYSPHTEPQRRRNAMTASRGLGMGVPGTVPSAASAERQGCSWAICPSTEAYMRRHSALALLCSIGGLLLALCAPGGAPASVALAAKEDYGFSGPRHQGVSLPTSDKPQSK